MAAVCKVIGSGIMPDVAWGPAGATLHVVWGQTPAVWAQFTPDGIELARETRPVGYFPKCNGRTVVFSDGAHFQGWHGTLAIPDAPVGNHPIGISPDGIVYHQSAQGVFCGSIRVADYRPTGIWESHDDASVTMWDHAYGRYPWAALSHECGALAVGEGLQGGIEGRIVGREFHLNGTAPSFAPRCAISGGRVAIVWCDYTPAIPQVWLWVGLENDLPTSTIVIEPEAEPEPATPEPQETPMKLTDAERRVVAAFAEKYPLTMGDADEDARREWTMRLAQTMRARISGMEWGTKRADSNRPLSKDAIAYAGAGRLWGFDVQVATGSGLRLNLDADGEDITGQVFVPVVAFDWLGGSTPEPTPDPDPQPEPTPDPSPDLAVVVARIEAKLDRVIAAMRGV